jgi:hypothetical protein
MHFLAQDMVILSEMCTKVRYHKKTSKKSGRWQFMMMDSSQSGCTMYKAQADKLCKVVDETQDD